MSGPAEHRALLQRFYAAFDQRDGAVRSAAQRERARLNAGLGRTAKRVAIAVGVVCLAAIGIGLVLPIGMFGFLSILGFLAVLTVGFIYEWRKGALDWE